MSLLDNFLQEKCVLLEKKRTPDGAGGWLVEWADGAEFNAAVVLDTSMQSRIAEKEGVTSVYTVTTRRSTPLSFHDVFRREKTEAFSASPATGPTSSHPSLGRWTSARSPPSDGS